MNQKIETMKNEQKKRLKVLIGIAAFASVPVTLFALSGYDLSVYNWGWIGSGSGSGSGSSSSGPGQGTLIVGLNNQPITTYISNPGNSLIAGTGLIQHDQNSIILGKFNADTGADELLVVGSGVSGAAENAFEIHKDGTVLIGEGTTAPIEVHPDGVILMEKQGDVSMGIFAPAP